MVLPSVADWLGPISDSAALSIVWSAALRSLVPRGVDKTVFFSVLFPATRSFEGRRCCSVSCSQRGDEMRPIAKSEPVSIFWRAPPNSGSFLGLFPTGCAIPSASLSCSNDEPCRHGLCSSFRSSEYPPCRVYRFRPWLAEMSQLEDGSLPLHCSPGPWPRDCRETRTNGLQCPPAQKMLPTSCAYGNERRNRCAFQPVPMRCARLNQGLPTEEFVELTPEPAEASVHSAVPFYAEGAAGAGRAFGRGTGNYLGQIQATRSRGSKRPLVERFR